MNTDGTTVCENGTGIIAVHASTNHGSYAVDSYGHHSSTVETYGNTNSHLSVGMYGNTNITDSTCTSTTYWQTSAPTHWQTSGSCPHGADTWR